MAIRTVRLDDKEEDVLREIRRTTGLQISEALKQGLHALQRQVNDSDEAHPFQIYELLDLGQGGYSNSSSTSVREGVIKVLRKKHRR